MHIKLFDTLLHISSGSFSVLVTPSFILERSFLELKRRRECFDKKNIKIIKECSVFTIVKLYNKMQY